MGEVSPRQTSTPLFRATFGALARYLPGLSLIFFLYDPLASVVVLPTLFQPLLVLRWILTGTLAAQAVNPSPTLTFPLATRCFFRPSVTLLECVLLTVKFVALVAVPPGVVTLILPVVAPVGTVAVICVAESTLNVVALVVLNFTELVVKVAPLTVPLKFVPVIVTDVPTGPKAGVNELIVGAGAVTRVKFVPLVRCPAAVYTWIGPVVAPAGTTAVTDVALVVVGVTRLEVLKRTWVGAVVKVPLIVTVVPTKPVAGVKVGTPGQVAAAAVVYADGAEIPSLFVTSTGFDPVPVAIGIATSSWVSASMVRPVPLVPPNSTRVAGPPFATVWKFVPVTVTSHPRAAVLGVTAVTVGTAA